MYNDFKGFNMKYIIKRNLNLLGNNNAIKFGYNVKLNDNKNGFKNFDIGNEEIMIDSLLKNLSDNSILELDGKSPIYVSLSNYFFTNLTNLDTIEYETDNFIAKVMRDDIV